MNDFKSMFSGPGESELTRTGSTTTPKRLRPQYSVHIVQWERGDTSDRADEILTKFLNFRASDGWNLVTITENNINEDYTVVLARLVECD
jgi:hypothetical protein